MSTTGHEIPETKSHLRVTMGKSSSAALKVTPSPLLALGVEMKDWGKHKLSATFLPVIL